MVKRIESLKIIENRPLKKDFFILDLAGNGKIPEMKPGQFVEIKIDGSPDTFLRRPISIHDVNYGQNFFSLLIQIVGKGTQTLSKIKRGESLNLIYPLGNSFSLPPKGSTVLLIGGGCGIAPLLFLGKYLKSNNFTPDVLLGFKNSERVIQLDDYRQIGKVFLTTEDGSQGEKGFVTEHSMLEASRYENIYCCGPMPMLKEVAKYCRERNINCEVSLENLMACGIGACLCCVVDTVKGHLCTCTDGPVFNISDLKW